MDIKTENLQLLKLIYNELDKEEKTIVLDDIENNSDREIVYKGLVIMKERNKFSNINDHINFLSEGKRKLNEFYEELIRQKTDNKRIRIKVLSYSVAASLAAFIISFGLFQFIMQDSPKDNLALIEQQNDSLKQELTSINEENQILLASSLQKEIQLDSVNQIFAIQSEQLNILKNNPAAINEFAMYRSFTRKRGYNEELIVIPTDDGTLAGGSDIFEVDLKLPKDQDFFFLNMPLKFTWSTKQKGKGQLNCYYVKNDDSAFEETIILENGSFLVNDKMKLLKPGTYYWMISKDELVSKKQYFVLLP